MVREEVVKPRPSSKEEVVKPWKGEAKLKRGSGEAKLKLKPRRKKMTWGFVTCGPNEALVISGSSSISKFQFFTRQTK